MRVKGSGAMVSSQERNCTRRRAHQATLDGYRKLEATYFPGGAEEKTRGRAPLYAYFTLRRGILLEEDSIRWCRWAISQLRRRKTQGRAPEADSEEG